MVDATAGYDEKKFAKSVDSLFTDIKSFMSDTNNIKHADRSSIKKAQESLNEVQLMIDILKKENQQEEEEAVTALISTLSPHKLIQFDQSIKDLSEFLRLGHKVEPSEGAGKGSQE